MEHLHLKIDGMSCGHCVKAVERALAVPGVQVKKVAVGSADVEVDATRVKTQELLRRIAEEGYQAEVA